MSFWFSLLYFSICYFPIFISWCILSVFKLPGFLFSMFYFSLVPHFHFPIFIYQFSFLNFLFSISSSPFLDFYFRIFYFPIFTDFYFPIFISRFLIRDFLWFSISRFSISRFEFLGIIFHFAIFGASFTGIQIFASIISRNLGFHIFSTRAYFIRIGLVTNSFLVNNSNVYIILKEKRNTNKKLQLKYL